MAVRAFRPLAGCDGGVTVEGQALHSEVLDDLRQGLGRRLGAGRTDVVLVSP